MPFATFDLQKYPVVQITFCGAPASQQEMDQYLAQFEGLLLAAATMENDASATCDAAASNTVTCEVEAAEGSGGEEAEGAGEETGIKFIIDLGLMSMGASVTMLTYAPQQIEFIQRLHRDASLVGAIAATAIIVRNDTARRVVEWVIGAVTPQRPFAVCADTRDAAEWLRGLSET